MMKHMILSFKMMGDVISDHSLMLWLQKDSLDTVVLRTFRSFRWGAPGGTFANNGLARAHSHEHAYYP